MLHGCQTSHLCRLISVLESTQITGKTIRLSMKQLLGIFTATSFKVAKMRALSRHFDTQPSSAWMININDRKGWCKLSGLRRASYQKWLIYPQKEYLVVFLLLHYCSVAIKKGGTQIMHGARSWLNFWQQHTGCRSISSCSPDAPLLGTDRSESLGMFCLV